MMRHLNTHMLMYRQTHTEKIPNLVQVYTHLHAQKHTHSEEVMSDLRNAGVKSLKTWLIEGMYGIKGQTGREREGEMDGGR